MFKITLTFKIYNIYIRFDLLSLDILILLAGAIHSTVYPYIVIEPRVTQSEGRSFIKVVIEA